ncbi:MAG TPA: protein-L-isoaspartate(D-aspartate) O-methyltransferase [Stenotrophomonas sp.]|nr:protein-L-isoaspartate(D-aspartate) O-methyltransferase [Stenotrophomonas sp.]
MPPRDAAREQMLAQHLRGRDIHDARVLQAMARVPREAFVEAGNEAEAYADHPLPIGAGQTISQPYIVALMAQAAMIGPEDRVLEVGTGSGYAAAVLAELARRVDTVERHAVLAQGAAERLVALGYRHVQVHHGDGSIGWPANAPYDAVLVAAAAPALPPALCEQLAPGGRAVIPIGAQAALQCLCRFTRSDGVCVAENLGGVVFVPLIGEQGWPEADAAVSC